VKNAHRVGIPVVGDRLFARNADWRLLPGDRALALPVISAVSPDRGTQNFSAKTGTFLAPVHVPSGAGWLLVGVVHDLQQVC